MSSVSLIGEFPDRFPDEDLAIVVAEWELAGVPRKVSLARVRQLRSFSLNVHGVGMATYQLQEGEWIMVSVYLE